ncbi:hypothetical protein [Desulfoluna spongiiphila]|uniref:Uncharacterized protein n=1 Tax=Desulfoluna spongiiphila TaxID=419481 RepID=A0A1G5AHU4_9BACT|nr:hypothetical protein [Desulfoluna spongiiphila]SCX77453.1 hypothetical protein SAMN05216233_101198 [Desulfoluna spongiiphila]
MKKTASGGQGMIPWTPGCECSPPLVSRGESIREDFHKITLKLFIKLFKSLVPGRAAEGFFL